MWAQAQLARVLAGRTEAALELSPCSAKPTCCGCWALACPDAEALMPAGAMAPSLHGSSFDAARFGLAAFGFLDLLPRSPSSPTLPRVVRSRPLAHGYS